MPKFGCWCGHSISLHAIPCPNDGTIIWDADKLESLNEVCETVLGFFEACRKSSREAWLAAAGWPRPGEVDDDLVVRHLLSKMYRRGSTVVRCPECGRIYIEPPSGTNSWACFAPDTQPHLMANGANTDQPQSPPSADQPPADGSA